MNFKEHFTLIKEAIENSYLEFLIHIKLYEPALDKIKAKPGYLSMVEAEKTKIFFSPACTAFHFSNAEIA